MSSKLTIYLNNINYIQVYIGIRNPFILSETTKGHKNVHFILESVKVNQVFSDSLITSLNSGKMVFVNTKSVYKCQIVNTKSLEKVIFS